MDEWIKIFKIKILNESLIIRSCYPQTCIAKNHQYVNFSSLEFNWPFSYQYLHYYCHFPRNSFFQMNSIRWIHFHWSKLADSWNDFFSSKSLFLSLMPLKVIQYLCPKFTIDTNFHYHSILKLLLATSTCDGIRCLSLYDFCDCNGCSAYCLYNYPCTAILNFPLFIFRSLSNFMVI